MGATVTFRLDPETTRILKDLTRRTNGSKSRAIKEALRAHWRTISIDSGPSSWEIYSRLSIPPGMGRKRNRARHVSRAVKEILRAKRRLGTL
jgi:ribbon-helix-helix CopG family protein